MDVMEDDGIIHDNGGTRSGKDRRQNPKTFQGEEQRAGKDRRQEEDRRNGLSRRKTPNRRNTNLYWDDSRIERRDAFRKRIK